MRCRSFIIAICSAALLVFGEASALAQCAMCKASVQAQASSSVDPQAASDIFNVAVFVLLIPPVLLFVALFLLLYRYRKSGADFNAAGAFD